MTCTVCRTQNIEDGHRTGSVCTSWLGFCVIVISFKMSRSRTVVQSVQMFRRSVRKGSSTGSHSAETWKVCWAEGSISWTGSHVISLLSPPTSVVTLESGNEKNEICHAYPFYISNQCVFGSVFIWYGSGSSILG
jgi:hypothetical protein